MSLELYDTAGLRAWRQDEIRLRNRIKDALVNTVESSLLDLNQMWRFEEVDTPVMMPRELLSSAYSDDDVFLLKDSIAGKEYALRAETTLGSYLIAKHMISNTRAKPPLCVYTMGQSFRQERSDGATAAKMRLNAFYQLEFQCIYAEGTTAPIAQTLRDALVQTVLQFTGPVHLIESDRLPSYSEETYDIEVWQKDRNEYREVASTSLRTDFPSIPGQRPCRVFEVAFGMDRMVALAQGSL
jgi:glycyl-tRNA synthetase